EDSMKQSLGRKNKAPARGSSRNPTPRHGEARTSAITLMRSTVAAAAALALLGAAFVPVGCDGSSVRGGGKGGIAQTGTGGAGGSTGGADVPGVDGVVLVPGTNGTWTDGVHTWAGSPFCNQMIGNDVSCSDTMGPISAMICANSPARDAGE